MINKREKTGGGNWGWIKPSHHNYHTWAGLWWEAHDSPRFWSAL